MTQCIYFTAIFWPTHKATWWLLSSQKAGKSCLAKPNGCWVQCLSLFYSLSFIHKHDRWWKWKI